MVSSILLVAPQGIAAVDEPGWSYELSDEIMSPFCPGRALSECPSPQATELRAWILEQEAAGVSREAVEAELFGVWGDTLLQAPRASGFGLYAYLIPFAGVAGGAALVVVFLRRQRRTAAAAPAPAGGAPAAPLDPELERILEEELETR